MEWVASLFGGKMPEADIVRTGIREFVEAMKFKNCEYDDRMEKALLQKRQSPAIAPGRL